MYLFIKKVTDDRQVKNAASLVPVTGEAYSSAYRFNEEMLEYLNENDTVSGFDGDVMGEWFILDLDIRSKNISKLTLNLIPFFEYLKENNIDYKLWWSGQKGFHFYIHKNHVKYNKEYETKWNELSAKFARHVMKRFNINPEYLDFSIYDRVRVFRFPFSTHPATNIEKTLLKYNGLNELNPAHSFIKLTPNKQQVLNEIFRGTDLIDAEKFFDITKEETEEEQRAAIESGDSKNYLEYPYGEKICIYKMINTRDLTGSRHTVALRLQSYWSEKGYNKAYVRSMLDVWNANLDNPLQLKEIDNVLKYYDKQYIFTCKDPVKQKFCVKSCHYYPTKDEEDILIYSGDDYLKRYFVELQKSKEKWIYLGDPFGWNLNPIKPGHTVVVAGAPSSGKTTLMLNSMLQQKHIKWLFLSLEMTTEDITEKFLKIQEKDLEIGEMDEEFTSSISHIYTIDKPDVKAESIEDLIRIATRRARGDINAVVIDYISLLSSKGHNQTERTIKIAQAIKLMVKKLKVSVFVLSQVPKELGGDGNIPLGLDAPKDSGEVVNLADMLLTAWRPNKGRPDRKDDIMTIGVAKNRHGRAGYTQNLRFIGEKYQIKGIENE